MPRIGVNLQNVKELEVIPVGQYRVKISNAQVKAAKSGDGSQVIEWEVTIQDAPHTGRKLFVNHSLKETALWNLKRFVEAAGGSYDETGLNTEDMLGEELVAVVEHELYKGKPRARVNDYLKAV